MIRSWRQLIAGVNPFRFEQKHVSYLDGKGSSQVIRTIIKKLKKPIPRLQSRKPAPSADDAPCSTPVQYDAVPLLTSAVTLPEINSAQ